MLKYFSSSEGEKSTFKTCVREHHGNTYAGATGAFTLAYLGPMAYLSHHTHNHAGFADAQYELNLGNLVQGVNPKETRPNNISFSYLIKVK